MKHELLAGPAETKEERREQLLSARPALKVVRSVLYKRLKNLEEAQQAKAEYELAGWPYKQADFIGSKRELQYLIDLLTLDQEETQ
jgi:hypothetical protein